MPARKRTCLEKDPADVLDTPGQLKQESLSSKLRKKMDDSPEKTSNTISPMPLKKPASVPGGMKKELCNFSARMSVKLFPSQSHYIQQLQSSLNVTHYVYGVSTATASSINKQSAVDAVVRELDDFALFRTASAMSRRVTALEWHPTRPELVGVGSKGGDLFLWNTLKQNVKDPFVEGMGPGGSIQALKFWPWNNDLLLTASIDGRVTLNDFEGKHSQILSDTFSCCEFWYCSVDVSAARKTVVAGDNMGNTLLLSLEGKKLWSHRLHKEKVTHVEFSPKEDWLLCTASVDRTVKLWDVRKMAGRDSALSILSHDRPINSAYFSRTDGCRLLTTDQFDQLRVYRAPEWHLERTIEHPHRFFQHITPIKASWHPLVDLIVVGRYPTSENSDKGERRTVDIISADSGKRVVQIQNRSQTGLISLNKFNNMGDFLISSMGVNLLLWGRRQDVEERREILMKNCICSFHPSAFMCQRLSDQNRHSRQSKKDNDVKTKLKLKTKTMTKKDK